MRRLTSHKILCMQCAHVYPDCKGDTLSCRNCNSVILRRQYDLLLTYSREAVGFGHIYRVRYEKAKAQDDRNTRASIPVHDIWAFAALAALSGIIGNTSFEIVRLVIRRILASIEQTTASTSKRTNHILSDDVAITAFLKNLADFATGMNDVDPWVKHMIVEEMLVDQTTSLTKGSSTSNLGRNRLVVSHNRMRSRS
jgi:hypothetical protein